MFTLIGVQGIKSDKGFIVETINRYVIQYTELLGEIDIPYDTGSDGTSVVYYVDEIEFYRWNDGRRIPEQKKCKILNNVIEAMKFIKVVVVVE